MTSIERFQKSYKKVQTETASPERVLLLLLEGARRSIFLAGAELKGNRTKNAQGHLRRAIDIVTELQGTLNPKAAPELCEHLHQVYGFIVQRLLVALRDEKDAIAAVDDAGRVLAPVADGFAQAIAQLASPPRAAAGGGR